MTTFTRVLAMAMSGGTLKKLVLSKPENGVFPAHARLCTVRGEPSLAFEEALGGGKVRHRTVGVSAIDEEFCANLLSGYRQANLLTTVGDAEYRRAKGGREVFLGGDKLLSRLSKDYSPFVGEIAIDRQKKYILTGKEPFLYALGITAENGRIHDKKQAKFRQINRFLEHVAEIYPSLPSEGRLLVYDLCCGKSYLSFAVYHYLTVICGREVEMIGIDLKADVIEFCNGIAEKSGFSGMRFYADDIRNTPKDRRPHLVVSLHACDIATDIVLDTAAALSADVILSTPCCHRYMNSRVKNGELSFITAQPFLRNKLCEVATDALRLMRLSAAGYRVAATELTDPDDTPKNTLLRALRRKDFSPESEEAKALSKEYEDAMRFMTGSDSRTYFQGMD